VTKPGALTLYGGIQSDFADGMHPYDSIPWRKKTTLKLVPFDNWAAYLDSSGAQVTLERSLGLDRTDSED
ncbi:unnamed protein product, partial [Symbiodinium necroappetens]